MSVATQNLLQTLRREYAFLQLGGYDRCWHEPWRAPLLFEDSLTCPNPFATSQERDCRNCPLIGFVHKEYRTEPRACRFIPLTELGETVDDLYRCGTMKELHQAFSDWLRRSIRQLEAELESSPLRDPDRGVESGQAA